MHFIFIRLNGENSVEISNKELISTPMIMNHKSFGFLLQGKKANLTYLTKFEPPVVFLQLISPKASAKPIRETSSFPVIHNIGNIRTFVLLKVENKLWLYHFNSKDHDKGKCALKLIRLSNLFPLELVQ